MGGNKRGGNKNKNKNKKKYQEKETKKEDAQVDQVQREIVVEKQTGENCKSNHPSQETKTEKQEVAAAIEINDEPRDLGYSDEMINKEDCIKMNGINPPTLSPLSAQNVKEIQVPLTTFPELMKGNKVQETLFKFLDEHFHQYLQGVSEKKTSINSQMEDI